MIEDTFIEIHNDSSSLPFLHLKDGEYFGILNMKMKKTQITKQPIFLLFTIDKTGSMNDYVSRGSKKIDYVIQTFVNMTIYLCNLDAEVYIQVNAFDKDVSVLVDCVKVNANTIFEINRKIRDIVPDGSTNIEAALTCANSNLRDYSMKNPSHQIGHLFMTDGEATAGEVNDNILCELVNDQFTNIFVGFGHNHNVRLLRKCSEKKKAEYHFIDNMEHTGLIYGEALHQFIYPALHNVELRIENGLLYDWRTNSWSSSIYEDVIIGEVEKIYHIKTTHPSLVGISIYGEIATNLERQREFLDSVISIPDLEDMETGEIIKNDITKYAFRQKVQELLYEANQFNNLNAADRVAFKKYLKDTFHSIRKYMNENESSNDGLLKMLCDDIVITYRNLNTNYGSMLTMARQSSQGRQQVYNATPIRRNSNDDQIEIPATPKRPDRPRQLFRRQTGNIDIPSDDDISMGSKNTKLSLQLPEDDDINEDTFAKYEQAGFTNRNDVNSTVFRTLSEESDDEDDEDDEIESYVLTNNTTTCFATPSALQTIRDVSQTYTDNSIDEYRFN